MSQPPERFKPEHNKHKTHVTCTTKLHLLYEISRAAPPQTTVPPTNSRFDGEHALQMPPILSILQGCTRRACPAVGCGYACVLIFSALAAAGNVADAKAGKVPSAYGLRTSQWAVLLQQQMLYSLWYLLLLLLPLLMCLMLLAGAAS